MQEVYGDARFTHLRFVVKAATQYDDV